MKTDEREGEEGRDVGSSEGENDDSLSEGVDGDAENEEVVEDGEVIPDPTRPRPRASSGDGGLSGGAQQAAPVLGRGRGRGRAQSSPPMRLPQAAVDKPLIITRHCRGCDTGGQGSRLLEILPGPS